MAGAPELTNGINQELLIEGFRIAVQGYNAAFATIDPEALTRETGPNDGERQALHELNPDVIVPDALTLTEDMTLIRATPEYGSFSEWGDHEEQRVVNLAVGRAVAQNLFVVTHAVEMMAALPEHAVAIFEVNANRGFERGGENSEGCDGMPRNWLGHVAIDDAYLGAVALEELGAQRKPIDYMGETDAPTTYGAGLDRNAARIRICPSFPVVKSSHSLPTPLDIFLVRTDQKIGEYRKDKVKDRWVVLGGGGRLCRPVAVLHDLTDWRTSDFKSSRSLLRRIVLTPS